MPTLRRCCLAALLMVGAGLAPWMQAQSPGYGMGMTGHGPGNVPETLAARVHTDVTCARLLDVSGEWTAPGAPAHAGGSLSDLELTLGGGYAESEDTWIGGTGRYVDAAATVSGTWANRVLFTLTAGHERYWHGDTFRTTDEFVDVVALYRVNANIAVGPFVEMSVGDTEATGLPDGGSTRWASGLILALNWDVGFANIGLTNALASMNKRNFNDLFDNTDTALAHQLDVYVPVGEHFSVTPYAYYYALLDTEREIDNDYFIVGVDLGYRVSAQWRLSVGYDRYVANEHYDQDRYTAGVTYTF